MQRFYMKKFLAGLFLGLHLTFKLEAICFSETSANLSRTIQRHMKEVGTISLKAK
jgi:hypothetical protein